MTVEPGKNFSGQRGFPTPDTLPETSACRTFFIPANDDWLGLLDGAIAILREEWAYYQWGSFTPAEAAQKWNEIINQAYEDSLTEVCGVVPAPYWDDTDGSDADDEAPEDDQDWYGFWDGETFLESISYWAVTAFLATGVSEGAAIEFITPLRKFRLLLKRDPHGAKLLVYMDANIFQLVDLFSATEDVVSVDIVSPGSTLMLVHTGEHNPSATPDADGHYTVNVLRKELTEAEVTPSTVRVNLDTNIFQISPDGGTTWNNAAGCDPRTNDAYFLPPLTPYEGIRCDVAARMVAQLKDTLDIFLASGDAAQSVTGWLGLLVIPFGLVGWFVDLLLAGANALIDIGQSNIEEAFTEEVYADILCSFFCVVDDSGRLTQAALERAYDEIEATHAGIVANVIAELRFFYGDVPMLNAGVTRDDEGDCSECEDCEWCTLMDTTNGWEGYTSLQWVSGTGTAATLSAGVWTNGLSGDGRARVIALKFAGAAGKHLLQFITHGDVNGWHFKYDCTGDDYINTGTSFTPVSEGASGSSWDAPSHVPVLVTSAVYIFRNTIDTPGDFHLDQLKMMGRDASPPFDENCP